MTRKNKIYLVLVFFLGFGVIWNESRSLSLEELSLGLSEVNWFWIGVAFLCMLVHWGIEAKIIQVFLKRTYPSFSFRDSYRIPLIEHLFNAITPFSTGGQPAQIVALSKSGVDSGVAASVSLMKFVVYQVWIVINFMVCFLLGFTYIQSNLKQLLPFIILSFLIHFVIVLGLLMTMYWYPFTQKMVTIVFHVLQRIRRGAGTEALRKRTLEKLMHFYEESRYMRTQPKMMLKASGLTVLQLIAYYVVPYFILLGIGVSGASLIQVVVLHAFIILLISLFPVPGGIGGAEYSFGLLFAAFIQLPSQMVLAILLWRVVTYYIGIILGMMALAVKPITQHKRQKKVS